MGHVHGRQVYVLMNKNLWLLILSQIFAFTAAPVTVFLSGIIGSQFSPIKSLATLPMALSIVGIAIFAMFAAKVMSIIGRRLGFIFASIGSSLASLMAAAIKDARELPIDAKMNPSLLPIILITFAANIAKIAIPTIDNAIGNVAKDFIGLN